VDLTALERRMLRLETLASRLKLVKASPMGEPLNDKVSMLDLLEDIARELTLLREDAHASGDHRKAMACIREFCRVAELEAKLSAKFDQSSQSKVSHIDSATAKRIALTYLDRRKDKDEPNE
jgi:hypothetical protein